LEQYLKRNYPVLNFPSLNKLFLKAILIFLFIGLLSGHALAQGDIKNKQQDSLSAEFSHDMYRAFARYVCPCASITRSTTDSVFDKCLLGAFMEDSIAFINEVIRVYGDTTAETMTAFGLGAGKYLMYYMVDSCDWMYQYFDSVKTHGFDQNNPDTLLARLTQIRALPKQEWPPNYHIIEGVYYFMTNKFEMAVESWDKYLSANPYEPAIDFVKGVALEKQGKFDEAIIVYEDIYRLTDNFQYKIFVACARVAKRKATQ
jgi:tetratricopeptide (TPR) repeat protein